MESNRLRLMVRLTALVGRLIPVLLGAVVLGTLGYLSASFIVILGGSALLGAVGASEISLGAVLTGVFVFAACRGLLRYFEQLLGHYMAFKLLAVLRDRVFTALRILAPAKLENKNQGELVSTVTNDIELLEVFYAHTLAPTAIAIIASGVMVLYIGSQHVILGAIAAVGYLCVGAVIPAVNFKMRNRQGQAYKEKFATANSFLLENLYGLPETLRFGQGWNRKNRMEQITDDMEKEQQKLKKIESRAAALTDGAVLFFSGAVLFAGLWLFQNSSISFSQLLLAAIAVMSSFGPTVALSNLSNDLTHTVAAGERVLALLDEKPETPEVKAGQTKVYHNIRCEDVGFSYGGVQVLGHVDLSIPKMGITGISGESGSGKTTLLKLIMRFWDVQRGRIMLSEEDIRTVNTKNLREIEGYVTQDTFLFEGTLSENIRLPRPKATPEEVEEAAESAGIHDFICTLPRGYDTPLGELGDGLSAGQRQRIGLARAFLHRSPLLLLDEPTSNLDSLNEAVILHSLKKAARSKSVVLVSHRLSTLRIADTTFSMSDGTLRKQ